MKLFKNPVLKVVGLLALAGIFMGGCTDDPQAPDSNLPPNTFVTTYGIDTAPDTAAQFWVTVYWRASDVDGRPEYYRYWVTLGSQTVLPPAETFETSARVLLDFADLATEYTFNVQARDSQGEWDPTPATMTISMTDVRDVEAFAPSTVPVTVPPNGATISTGALFVINGSDLDGFVASFQWAVDDTAVWTTVQPSLILPAASTAEIVLGPTILTPGAHTTYFRSIDNWGNVDGSPLTVSFFSDPSLRPDLTVLSGPIPNAFYFLPSGGTTVDLAAEWAGDAAWYFSTLQYRFAVDDSSVWSAWQISTTALLIGLTAGSHQFFVEAMDLAGNSTIFSTSFGVGQLAGDRGLLVVNGVDWGTYTPEGENMYANILPFGSLGFDFWDLLDGSGFYPPNVDSALIGSGGAIPGDTLGHYSSAVFFMNAFNGDDAIYNAMFPLIISYLNAGGNVLLACRFGALFVKGDLAAYGVGTPLEFNNEGVNPSSLVPAVSGLVEMTRFSSSSLTDLLATPSDPHVTVLFTVPNYPESVGGIVVEPDNGGKFVFVAGRMYRFDHAPLNANFTYILTNYFGE